MPVAGVKFNHSNAPAAARNSHRLRPGHQLRQMLDAQQSALASALSEETEEKNRAALMRAYHDLTRLIMDWTGQGKPKPVPAKNEPAKTKTRPSVL
jgi:hypothetical protein